MWRRDMPWDEASRVDRRGEFVALAEARAVPFVELCRRYGISPKTGYKWLARFALDGPSGLLDRSSRPLSSPTRTSAALEEQVCELRRRHPAWGGRKISKVLTRSGVDDVPAPSTITGILRRHGLLNSDRPARGPFIRFEEPAPNDLWQMDFKGWLSTVRQGQCHPFGVLDDHSRYNLCLQACSNQQTQTVQRNLTVAFRRYGLPKRMLMDNGSPWGNTAGQPWTPLTVWLLDLGITVSHSRPFHPQTQGKEERFHYTLQLEVLNSRTHWDTLDELQAAFDTWRPIYNRIRPHQGINDAVPADRYQPSPRPFPTQLAPIEYPADFAVRTVASHARLSYQGHKIRVGRAFANKPVALTPGPTDGTYHIYYRHQHIKTIDLTQ